MVGSPAGGEQLRAAPRTWERRSHSRTPFLRTSIEEGAPRVVDLCSPLKPCSEEESFLGVAKWLSSPQVSGRRLPGFLRGDPNSSPFWGIGVP